MALAVTQRLVKISSEVSGCSSRHAVDSFVGSTHVLKESSCKV